jgi:diamine N-acetyltransferase
MMVDMYEIRLRVTQSSDLDFVLRAEADPENRRFILPWERTQHAAALQDPDLAHWVMERSTDGSLIGFVLLAGLMNQHGSLEFRRVVVVEQGYGYGRLVVRLVKRFAFEKRRAHRLWLDVLEDNQRARGLYRSEGFVEEGRLREAVWTGGRYASLVLMAILASEYTAA